MSLHKIYYVTCTDCSNQFTSKTGDHHGETPKEVRDQAKVEGWKYTRVQNGSYWDLCPRCQRDRSER